MKALVVLAAGLAFTCSPASAVMRAGYAPQPGPHVIHIPHGHDGRHFGGGPWIDGAVPLFPGPDLASAPTSDEASPPSRPLLVPFCPPALADGPVPIQGPRIIYIGRKPTIHGPKVIYGAE